jgi:hypothetical protein
MAWVVDGLIADSQLGKETPMRAIVFIVASLLAANTAALAGSVDQTAALALAALAAEHSPAVKASDKMLLAKFLNGDTKSASKNKITVAANAITCKAGDVDITMHQCDLTFGTKKVTTHGRKVHELYATLAEAGVPSDGAAGSVFEAVSNLNCTIDPDEVRQKGGGGAHCTYDPAK